MMKMNLKYILKTLQSSLKQRNYDMRNMGYWVNDYQSSKYNATNNEIIRNYITSY